jgi:hypothetical protein
MDDCNQFLKPKRDTEEKTDSTRVRAKKKNMGERKSGTLFQGTVKVSLYEYFQETHSICQRARLTL